MPRANICADCLEYRSESRLKGSCTMIEGAPLDRIDEARNRRICRWNDLACKHFSERIT